MLSFGLSPARTVRSRFFVPGEGNYDLRADVRPPPRVASPVPRPPSTPTTGAPALAAVSGWGEAGAPPRPGGVGSAAPLAAPRPLGGVTAGAASAAGVGLPDAAAAPPALPPGLLAYTHGDAVSITEVTATAGADPLLTVHLRSNPTAVEIEGLPDGGARLLIGCANGDVVYYADVSVAVAAGSGGGSGGRGGSGGGGGGAVGSGAGGANGTAADAGGSAGGGAAAAAVGAAGSLPGSTLFNKDGATGARVTAVRWVPGSPSRFIATAVDGAVVMVLDLVSEQQVVSFRSYYGALLTVSWSPDALYLATGGEDDLVSVWSPWELRIVARGEGHTSWVSDVGWDPVACGGGRYRVGSVAQDAKLLLWDFDVDSLHVRSPRRPGTKLARGIRHVAASAASSSLSSESAGANTTLLTAGPVKAAPSRAEVPTVDPVAVHVAHVEPLTAILFYAGGVLTAATGGEVKLWARPPTAGVPPLRLSGSGSEWSPPPPGRVAAAGGAPSGLPPAVTSLAAAAAATAAAEPLAGAGAARPPPGAVELD
ncbi:hypothetical protein I4F81_006432 [Pyropia yezoensis]|uniref:Uncharacterized protein n=1 Tax=Pyropia yezoensis TaxID=2788 RepID=A0ACC3C165_PYRYE|nr:hypothetical protein I4F81_006432 [Neopyropia yezoensis]